MKRIAPILALASVLAGISLVVPAALAFDDSSSGSSTVTMKAPTEPTLSKKERANLELETGLLARSLEDAYENSKYAGAVIGMRGGYRLSDLVSARWDLKAIMTAGSASNQYSSTGKAPNGLWVDEAAVTFKPVSLFTAELGVILTEFSSLPSNFDSMGFPALRETLHLGGKDTQVHLFAMQAIPASDTVAVQPTEDGKTTQLFLYGANFTNNARDLSRFTLNAAILSFDFENLNSSAATDSLHMGNTVVPVGSQARFQYGFAGIETSAEMSYRFAPSWKALLNGAYLTNREAPEGLNKGYLYSAGVMTPLMGVETTFTGGYFYNEPDTLPASYTSVGKGSNNRFGQIARISMADKKEKVSGYLQYTRGNLIENRPYMADREIYVMGLEIGYDIL